MSLLPRAPSIIRELVEAHGLSDVFPVSVMAEVEAWLLKPEIDDPSLVDLTTVPFVTIDNEDSRDLDQAMFIEELSTGETAICYALADASHYVRVGSALFTEALRRGASFYLPGASIPMLPRALSEDLVSLNELQPRRALVLITTLGDVGQIHDTRIVRARILSRRKLSYRGVQAYFDDERSGPLAGQEFTSTLDLLAKVGRQRIAEARRRDVVQFERVESEVSFADPERTRLEASAERRNDVERWNEQISLLCNREAGRFLAEGDGEGVHAIYRIHPAPPHERLEQYRGWLDALIAARGLDPAIWRWRGDEALADFIARLPRGSATARVAAAVQRGAMLTQVASMFSATPGLHFGVGAHPYARASSPMREIVGVFTHKEMVEKASGIGDPAGDVPLRDEVIRSGNRAKELQKRLNKETYQLTLDQLFERDRALPTVDRPWRTGTVMGVAPDKIYVALDQPALDIKVYRRDLETYLHTSLTNLPGDVGVVAARADARWIIGDSIVLRVHHQETHRRRWVFDVATPGKQ